jgi:RNA polymerase sporulation-specific sigma factor
MLKQYIDEIKKVKLLSPKEEEELWRAVADGDERAREKLIISYQPLVLKTAAGFKLPEEQLLELAQEGMVGLIEAAERFECERGVAFSLFAVHRIKGRMLDYLKKYFGGGALCFDCAALGTDELLDRLADSAAGPEEIAEENFIIGKVAQVMAFLPENEQKVLRGLYFEHRSPDMLAAMIKVSQAHIYRLRKQGVLRIRGMLSRFIHELKW